MALKPHERIIFKIKTTVRLRVCANNSVCELYQVSQ
jgi:hypothetical protein